MNNRSGTAGGKWWCLLFRRSINNWEDFRGTFKIPRGDFKETGKKTVKLTEISVLFFKIRLLVCGIV